MPHINNPLNVKLTEIQVNAIKSIVPELITDLGYSDTNTRYDFVISTENSKEYNTALKNTAKEQELHITVGSWNSQGQFYNLVTIWRYDYKPVIFVSNNEYECNSSTDYENYD